MCRAGYSDCAAVVFGTDVDVGLAGAFHPSAVDDAPELQATAGEPADDVVPGWLDHEGIEDGAPFLVSRRPLRRRPEFVFPAEPRPGEHPRGDRLRPGGVSDLPVLSPKPCGHQGVAGRERGRSGGLPQVAPCRREWAAGAGSTWAREVATVNSFYRWAVESGFVEQNPIRQRPARARSARGHAVSTLTPAEAPKDGHRENLGWLPPTSYRRWRDIGVRGYLPGGLLDSSFRGRNAARNATFCDLMARTGLR